MQKILTVVFLVVTLCQGTKLTNPAALQIAGDKKSATLKVISDSNSTMTSDKQKDEDAIIQINSPNLSSNSCG